MPNILVVDNVHTFYGESYILQGLSLKVAGGSVVALIGRNGMGKTTLMRSVIGFTPCRRGAIWFKGQDITRLEPYKIARLGLRLVPQGRRIFPSLSVRENLRIAALESVGARTWDMERLLSVFPVLRARQLNRGNQLSGGEQQMLAVARALIANPELILMDEPSEGLAPIIIEEVGRIMIQLKKEGVSIMLAEQNLPLALNVADYLYVVNKGVIVFEGTGDELLVRPEIQNEYLAV
jgi:branched-chain amino acid transport system ATP-binding protein